MPHDPAVAHLRAVDPVMAELIARFGAERLDDRPASDRPSDHYGVLVRAIVGQQLSTRAAAAIFGRLTERFDGQVPTPEQILADDPDALRVAAGLSHAKVRYLRSLAEHVSGGSLDLDRLHELDDDAVRARLIAVDGIGPWSVDMLLIFHLHRPDVVASGDLGIRRAVMVQYGLTAMPTAKEVDARAEAWRPYRTLACELLWRSLNATPV